ncbi:NAD(P) transhydrogenase subunit alpha [Mesoterricola sediminis]|uniref:proton-translocating NAD(P)(+) transhydrogenase n=1 Tax=Mesoterricola sediminis TaxID=2927980 RepID=A0AA48GSR9_9BACT|nr:NAD(P) transhydrogenase subunit alpha [Mesoterricola sediminis]
MRVAVPKETRPGETRVAADPDAVRRLVALGAKVAVGAGAGEAAHFPDAAYAAAGASVVPDAGLLETADLVLRVTAPWPEEALRLRPGTFLLGSLFPSRHLDTVRALAAAGVTALSTDCLPRTTRAQAMDTLSSQANITGYRGALLAALALPRYVPLFMTAAGTTPQAKVFVIGAGVAGLQAIATARRLGAAVSATDVRPEVKEQIASVGGRYVGIDLAPGPRPGGGYAADLTAEDRARQAQLLAEHGAGMDALITTALIGGVRAPRLVDRDLVERLRPGSVVVDLGADGGGNCELSRPGETVVHGGVRILAPLNLPATMPQHASALFGRNLVHLLEAFWADGAFRPDWEDDLLRACVLTREGGVVHGPTREALRAEAAP